MAVNTTRLPLRSAHPRSATARRGAQQARPSDDEILGLVTSIARPAQDPETPGEAKASHARLQPRNATREATGVASPSEKYPAGEHLQALPQSSSAQSASAAAGQGSARMESSLTPEIAQILDAQPQLRAAWDAAQQFQSVFATPAAAQDAKSQLNELDEMFFSADPSAQAALAARIHELSPEAFHSLTQAMQSHTAQLVARSSHALVQQPNGPTSENPTATGAFAADAQNPASAQSQNASTEAPIASPRAGDNFQVSSHLRAEDPIPSSSPASNLQLSASKAVFFHSTNSAAVHQVLAAIESQVSHLLPASVSTPTKTRIVGEIYRDLGAALGANRQLGHQLRQAFRSGAGDAAHQRAIVSLVAGRARQALPSIARRVINEWTHGVVAANQEKLSRQSASAKRVDVSGGGASDGVNRRPVSPRDVDYKRLSDADILNL